MAARCSSWDLPAIAGEGILPWRLRVDQADRLFRTRGHAQAAGVTVGGPHHERLLAAVHEQLELADEGDVPAFPGRQLPYLEDVEGAHTHAVGLGLAAAPVDDRDDPTGLRPAARLRLDGAARH